jgi:ABC-2 type transport system permease protein
MTLLAVERIKFFSTRSPWFCIVAALGLTMGFAALFALNSSHVVVETTQIGYQFGLMVIMVMAALAITTEYRFSTIRTTFQAVPNRTKALLAKTVVVAGLSGVVGEMASFGSVGIAKLLQPSATLAISSADQWRLVGGAGLVYALAAVIAIAVGTLIRQSAGAVAILLVFPLLAEQLVTLIPKIGDGIHDWMPFHAASVFLNGPVEGSPYGPWAGLIYFTGIAVALLAVAITVADKRDA